MNKEGDQSESAAASEFDLSDQDLAAASAIVDAQMKQACGMWVAGLEVCNVLVRQWTESQKKALSQVMRTMAKSTSEPDLEKRSHLVAKAFTDQTNDALNDVLAASFRAMHVGVAHAQRNMGRTMADFMKFTSRPPSAEAPSADVQSESE